MLPKNKKMTLWIIEKMIFQKVEKENKLKNKRIADELFIAVKMAKPEVKGSLQWKRAGEGCKSGSTVEELQCNLGWQ